MAAYESGTLNVRPFPLPTGYMGYFPRVAKATEAHQSLRVVPRMRRCGDGRQLYACTDWW
jgi:hypothetical protein